MLRTLHETLPTDQYSLPAMAVAPNLRRHSGQTSMHTSMHTTTYCCPAARKQVQVVQNLIHVLHQIAVGEFAKAIYITTPCPPVRAASGVLDMLRYFLMERSFKETAHGAVGDLARERKRGARRQTARRQFFCPALHIAEAWYLS